MKEIEHTLCGTQIKYGYLWWPKSRNSHYKQLLPDGEFIIDLEGRRISGRRVDWSMGRVFVGKNLMKEHFQKDEPVKISRQSNDVIVVRKVHDREVETGS